MDPRLSSLMETLRLNGRLYRNCLSGLTAGEAPVRSAAFVAAHLVGSRYYLLGLLGGWPRDPGEPGDMTADPDGHLISAAPSRADLEAAWDRTSRALEARLAETSASALDAPLDTDLPLEHQTLLGALTFLVQHESYRLGQLGLLRQHAGLPAMAYD